MNHIYSAMTRMTKMQQHPSHPILLPSTHIIDWLGCGLSSRPKFDCKTTWDTESFFVESLEGWRKAMNIDKMVLCAHSLGAYMSTIYALKYPQVW